MADLKAQMEISVDASGVEVGVSKAKKSIASLGKAAGTAGAEGSKGIDSIAASSGRASRTIDAYIKRVQLSAATMGKTATESKLFELTQRGASRAQLIAAESAFRSIDSFKAQKAAIAATTEAHEKAMTTASRYGATIGTVSLAVAAAASAIVKSSLSAMDQFNDLADSTGASIENISALDRVARETGGSFETVAGALVKFNAILNKTDEYSDDAARVLKSLGLNAEALKRIDPAEALRQTAVALGKFADDGNKARAVQILFGKSIAEVAPLLKDLAEQSSLVATTSTRTAQEIEALNKKLFQIKANSQDAARALAVTLAPTIASLADEFIVGTKHARGFIDAILTFGTLNPFRSQASTLQSLRQELEELTKARDRYVRSGSDTRGLDDAIRQTQRQLAYTKDLQERQAMGSIAGMDVSDAVSRRMSSRAAPSLAVPGKTKTGARDPLANGNRYLEGLQRQLDKVSELGIEEQALAEIQSGRIGKIAPGLENQILSAARLIDLKKAQIDVEKASERAALDAAEAAGRMFDQAMRFAQDVETPFERLQRHLDEITKTVENNPLISGESAARASTKAWKEYIATIETANVEVTKLDDYAKHAAENIQDALGNGVYDVLTGNYKSITASFTQMVNRMVAEAVAADLSRKLFGSMVKGGTGEGLIGSVFTTAIGLFAGSGSASTLTTGDFARMDRMRAIGGPVSAGGIYQVNESGPELLNVAGKQYLMMGNQSGEVKPTGSGGNTVNVTVNQNFPVGTNRQTTMQAASDARRVLERAGRNL